MAGYVTGAGNQLQSDGVWDYVYDDESNLKTQTHKTTGEYREYSWDHRNRLTQVEIYASSGGALQKTLSFIYDVLDRRIGYSVDGMTRWTVYGRANAWLDVDDAATVQTRYLFSKKLDSQLARWRPGEGTVWYLKDKLGSVRHLVDADGNLLGNYHYDSFGNINQTASSALDGRYLFTGREYDEILGVYYYRSRYYNPSIGRFLSRDSMGFDAGDINLYRYVDNNPLIFTDPTGNAVAIEYSVTNINSKGTVSISVRIIGNRAGQSLIKVGDTIAKSGGTISFGGGSAGAAGTFSFGSGAIAGSGAAAGGGAAATAAASTLAF